jgi:hypothetical protein
VDVFVAVVVRFAAYPLSAPTFTASWITPSSSTNSIEAAPLAGAAVQALLKPVAITVTV